MKEFIKGMCYAPFPIGYSRATANDSSIFFGSDMASYNMKPLWGDSFTTKGNTDYVGRNDIKNLADLGVNLIRLYDWDARNNHIPFLDYCHENNIKVLVPVSNYHIGGYGKPPDMISSITNLINSFSKNRDYHPAIYGILIGSESDQLANIPNEYVIKYTNKWMEIESIAYSTYRKVMIGHPVSFASFGPYWQDKYPCFGYLDHIIPSLIRNTARDLHKRLMLCPHVRKEASYLYDNAENSRKGWVDLAYGRYNLPVLFCEIGCDKLSRPDSIDVITSQLERSMEYHANNPDKLLGICYYQYCDNGVYGIVSNTKKVTDIVHYEDRDFPFWSGGDSKVPLNIQVLTRNMSYKVIERKYLYG